MLDHYYRTLPVLAFAFLAGCASGGAARSSAPAAGSAPFTGAARISDEERARIAAHILARVDSVRLPYTDADVHFMTGMIPHHAQAVVMAALSPTRARDNGVKILSQRIAIAQRQEIALMRQWLGDRGLPVPDSNATHMRMNHGGVVHDMLMPGMLSDEEMEKLRNATGSEFDKLFLTYMIRHHAGAVAMVDELMAAPGAAQDEIVFRFAADVYADQTTEIDRMEKMLAAIIAGGGLR